MSYRVISRDMGLWKRLAKLAGPVEEDAVLTPVGTSGPTATEARTASSLDRVALPGDGRQSVVGESYRQAALRAVTRGVRLPVVTGDNWDESVSMTAELTAEPENRFDANAVRVEINNLHIGYLPAEDAPKYQRTLLHLAENGKIGTCESRLMIGPAGNICVYLLLAPPEEVAFAVHALEDCVPLLPQQSTTITHEEDHQDVLRQLAFSSTDAERWKTAELGFCTIAKGKYAGEEAIEVRLAGQRVGELSYAMTERYAKLVCDALKGGKTPICRAMLSITPNRGVQVELMMPRR